MKGIMCHGGGGNKNKQKPKTTHPKPNQLTSKCCIGGGKGACTDTCSCAVFSGGTPATTNLIASTRQQFKCRWSLKKYINLITPVNTHRFFSWGRTLLTSSHFIAVSLPYVAPWPIPAFSSSLKVAFWAAASRIKLSLVTSSSERHF